ncbi:ABC transporter ATP-binding protein [Lapidilactobacillus luobeiensis]|uniref:ABC transporter ATP-binding protein n=1 Tax=Lapidilactobacillus luobeiensis TaxID=2950371 RepID=UPI0021C3F32B|nr:ABC transporter ATP-binding protein [Lapidilactobacillus luobeiensis]
MSSLTVTNLVKKYPTFQLNVTRLRLEPGQIYGLIGPNGAGKSTLIKSLLGICPIDQGQIRFFEQPFSDHQRESLLQIGVVLGTTDYYREKRLVSLTKITRQFFPNWDQDRYLTLCRQFNLNEQQRVKELSTGMKVKYQLALALAHQAQLLILDEPTSGLDVVARRQLQTILRQLADSGISILLATHLSDDLERCADELIVLRQGQIIAADTLAHFSAAHRSATALTLDDMIVALEVPDNAH